MVPAFPYEAELYNPAPKLISFPPEASVIVSPYIGSLAADCDTPVVTVVFRLS